MARVMRRANMLRKITLSSCVRLFLGVLVLFCTPVLAQEAQLADRIVAVVDEDAILLSDVEQVIDLGLVDRQEGESDEALQRRVLDRLIDQKLRFHEIDRFGFSDVPTSEVDQAYSDFVQGFDSDEEAAAAISRAGLDKTSLRRLFARQLMVLTYVDERLGARVFVGVDDIQHYFDDVFTPELRQAGEKVPILSEVREQIRAIVKQSRLNDEIIRWTEELRAEADVLDYWDADSSDLPPVVTSTDGATAE